MSRIVHFPNLRQNCSIISNNLCYCWKKFQQQYKDNYLCKTDLKLGKNMGTLKTFQ